MTFVDDRAVSRLRAFSGEGGPPGGRVLDDRFEIGAPIGEGAMAVVWSAWDRRTEREVAVKIVRDAEPSAAARVGREARALAGLTHPAIVRYVGHGVTPEGQPYVAMERLEGRTLASLLRRGPLAPRDVVHLGRRLADALAEVHDLGVVHRDIKPSNVFLVGGSASGAKLVDFGLARDEDASAITLAGALVGTPGYMAPEQVRGAARVGPPADVFALGCVLLECATGHAAFSSQRGSEGGALAEDAVLAKILLEDPTRDAGRGVGMPAALGGVLGRMLAKSERDRPPAFEVARVFAEMDDRGRRRRAPRRLIAAAFATIGVLATGGAFALFRAAPRPQTTSTASAAVAVEPSAPAPANTRVEEPTAAETASAPVAPPRAIASASAPEPHRPVARSAARPPIAPSTTPARVAPAGSVDVAHPALLDR